MHRILPWSNDFSSPVVFCNVETLYSDLISDGNRNAGNCPEWHCHKNTKLQILAHKAELWFVVSQSLHSGRDYRVVENFLSHLFETSRISGLALLLFMGFHFHSRYYRSNTS